MMKKKQIKKRPTIRQTISNLTRSGAPRQHQTDSEQLIFKAGKRRTNRDSEESSDDQHAKKGADGEVSLDGEDVPHNKGGQKGQGQDDPKKNPEVRLKSPEVYIEAERAKVRKESFRKR